MYITTYIYLYILGNAMEIFPKKRKEAKGTVVKVMLVPAAQIAPPTISRVSTTVVKPSVQTEGLAPIGERSQLRS